mgnify:CR=1 FL=1
MERLPGSVALRKESVDRNDRTRRGFNNFGTSLSARRAWIEIDVSINRLLMYSVALRKESVDRNMLMRRTQTAIDRRSPQGERG